MSQDDTSQETNRMPGRAPATDPATGPDEEDEFAHIDAAAFDALDRSAVTLVDLREPDEQVVFPVEGALSAPFSGFPGNLSSIPRDKPIVVFCRVGDWSEQVAEILADQGAAVESLTGGIRAYRDYLAQHEGVQAAGAQAAGAQPAAPVPDGHSAAAIAPEAPDHPAAVTARLPRVVHVDARGLKCPGPIVKVGDAVRGEEPGTVFEVEATEDAFCSDIAVWCERTGNPLLKLDTDADGVIHVRLRKGDPAASVAGAAPGDVPASASAALPADVQVGHDKTFVVFSGDLDKTIAAFIIANGAAAMGRKVTMFFTFWGLNILRKPSRVQVAKGALERMFCAMMPRGTFKLGLSRMNMFGIGPKMIRFMMRKKGIASLEELIAQAQAHGVRIVACQMSMDIMGISKEELLDGVELGGVATFLGSGETSDMSLFI